MFNMDKFSNLLSSKRREKGLSQGQLAELIGVTHQAVSKWERGEAMPEISKIGDIAKILGVPTNELLNALYENEGNAPKEETKTNDADAEYFALPDKTHVGDIYALAPRLSKPTLHQAINTLVEAKGAGSASMLYPFAEKEFLNELGTKLFARGDTRLAAYVDDDILKSPIVECIASADSTMDNNTRIAFYNKAGQLLTYCKDAKFVNEMFEHFTNLQYRWDIWKPYVGRFPSEAVVAQGIRMAIHNGPGCFNTWWDIVGRRNIAKIFLGYVDNYEKNNYRAWADLTNIYGFADSAIMEKSIKERINDPETDCRIFKPLLRHFSDDLKDLLAQKGVVDTNQNNNQYNQSRVNRRKNYNAASSDMIELMVMDKLQKELDNADLEDIPDILAQVTASLNGFRSAMKDKSGNEGSEEMLVSIMEKLNDIDSRLEDIERRLADHEDRIEDIEDNND